MAHSSLQVCIDSSDHWFQGTMSEDMSAGLDSSTSPSGGDCMLAAACSSRGGGPALAAPLMERRLRPPHDQNLKCPRCDSNHTKFCYYNNYSLTQPRYFCKTCRRYWTKGGTLRNIPVGGGCRKNNKKSSSKKSSSTSDHQQTPTLGMMSQGSINTTMSGSSINPTDLHLSSFNQFPPHLANLIGAQMSLGGGGGGGGDGFMENGLIRPIDFMESNKYEAMVGVGGYRGHDFLGGGYNMNGGDQFAGILAGIDHQNGVMGSNEGNYSSGISFMDQRMMLPYDHQLQHHEGHNQNGHGLMDVKPNPKLLSLEWQDQGCTSNHGKESSFGYNVNGGGPTLASWSGIMSGFQPSTTNSIHWST